MPELPEVETIRRDLASRVEGRRITSVPSRRTRASRCRSSRARTSRRFARASSARVSKTVDRRGKYLVFRLDTEAMLVVHLRMTGALLHRTADAPPDPFLRAILHLDDGTELRFTDIRKFGGLWLTDDFELVTTGLGPEPLSEGFTSDIVADAVRGRKAPVKSIILDQRRIAGIGNIYADEACFAARHRPAASRR